MLSSGASAKAQSRMSVAQRRAFAQAMAHYEKVVGSIGEREIINQMRAEDGRLSACVPLLKQFYESPSDTGAAGELFDMTLHTGVQAGGEHWYVNAVIPLLASAFVKSDVRLVEEADICAVLGQWSREQYATAPHIPKIVAAMDRGGISPWAVIGTTHPARTFVSWGFGKSQAARLVSQLNAATGEYDKLDRSAYQEFLGWLQQQGIYQLMAPADRQTVSF